MEIEEAAKRTSFRYTISESPQDEGNCKISLLTSEDAVCRIRWNNFVIIGANSGEQCFRTIGGNSSGPADLLIFNPLRIYQTFLVLIIRFVIYGYCSGKWRSGVSFWGRVEFLPKMKANTSAFLFESETTGLSVVTSGGNEECLLKLLLNEFKVDWKILLSLGLFISLLVWRCI